MLKLVYQRDNGGIIHPRNARALVSIVQRDELIRVSDNSSQPSRNTEAADRIARLAANEADPADKALLDLYVAQLNDIARQMDHMGGPSHAVAKELREDWRSIAARIHECGLLY